MLSEETEERHDLLPDYEDSIDDRIENTRPDTPKNILIQVSSSDRFTSIQGKCTKGWRRMISGVQKNFDIRLLDSNETWLFSAISKVFYSLTTVHWYLTNKEYPADVFLIFCRNLYIS